MFKSISALVLRLIVWALSAAGVIGAEFAEFLVTDPDIAVVVNGVLGIAFAECMAQCLKLYTKYKNKEAKRVDVVDAPADGNH